MYLTVLLSLVLHKLLNVRQISRHIAKGDESLQLIYKGFTLLNPLFQKYLGQLVHVSNANADAAVSHASQFLCDKMSSRHRSGEEAIRRN